jgi:hypothetical protein
MMVGAEMHTACCNVAAFTPTLQAKKPRKACGEAGEYSVPQPITRVHLFTLCQAHFPYPSTSVENVQFMPDEAAPPEKS